jgi:hypothetical protein
MTAALFEDRRVTTITMILLGSSYERGMDDSSRGSLRSVRSKLSSVLIVLGVGVFVVGFGSVNYMRFSAEAAILMFTSGLFLTFGVLLRSKLFSESSRAEKMVAVCASLGVMLLTSALIPYMVVYTEDVLVLGGIGPRLVLYFVHPYIIVSIAMVGLALALFVSAVYVKYKRT